MAIQMRRGKKVNFDPQKMLPGEWAVSIDSETENQIVWMCFQPGVVKRMGTYEDFKEQVREATDDIKEEYMDTFNEIKAYMEGLKTTTEGYKNTASTKAAEAKNSAVSAKTSETNASKSATDSANSADESEKYSLQAKSYVKGTGGVVRPDDDSDCAEFYYEQTKRMAQGVNGMIPMGTITFAELPTSDILDSAFYNISDGFVSDERFTDGGGVTYGPGNNVYWLKVDGKWDVTASSSVTGVKGSNEASYRQGNVSLSANDVGAVPIAGDISRNTVTFEQAVERANINSDDSMSVAFGKLSKFCADLEKDVLGGLKGNVQEQIDGLKVFSGMKDLSEEGYYKLISLGVQPSIGDAGVGGLTFEVILSRNYSYAPPETYHFIVSLVYGGKMNLNVLSGNGFAKRLGDVALLYNSETKEASIGIKYRYDQQNRVSYRIVGWDAYSGNNEETFRDGKLEKLTDKDEVYSNCLLSAANDAFSLGRRTILEGDFNLDDYLHSDNIGNFSHFGGTLSGGPTGMNQYGVFEEMLSLGDNDGRYLRQIYHPYNSNAFACRLKLKDTIADWDMFYPNGVKTIQEVDLDGLVTDGDWFVISEAGCLNLPKNEAGWFSCRTSWEADRKYILQRYITYFSKKEYVRTIDAGNGISAWRLVSGTGLVLEEWSTSNDSALVIPSQGYLELFRVNGKLAYFACITSFDHMQNGIYNVAISHNYNLGSVVYLVGNPGTVTTKNLRVSYLREA